MSTKQRLHQAIDELPDSLTLEQAMERLYLFFKQSPPATLDQPCPWLDSLPAPPPRNAAEQKRQLGELLEQRLQETDDEQGFDRSFVSREAKNLLRRLDAGI